MKITLTLTPHEPASPEKGAETCATVAAELAGYLDRYDIKVAGEISGKSNLAVLGDQDPDLVVEFRIETATEREEEFEGTGGGGLT